MIYKLKIIALKCYLPDESDGDEIFILMNGNKIWPVEDKYQTITTENTTLDLAFEINKGDILKFELWDFDQLSRNDLLGLLNIEASAHGHYLTDFVKTGTDHSKYALEWELG